jgi:hypothetical protein
MAEPFPKSTTRATMFETRVRPRGPDCFKLDCPQREVATPCLRSGPATYSVKHKQQLSIARFTVENVLTFWKSRTGPLELARLP